MNHSSQWSFIGLIPMLESLVLIVWCGSTRSHKGANQWGENPLNKRKQGQKMGMALGVALGIILVSILIVGFLVLSGGSVSEGKAMADDTNNPLLGFLVGIFVFVIWAIVACAG